MPERTGQLGDLPGMGRREFLAAAGLLPVARVLPRPMGDGRRC